MTRLKNRFFAAVVCGLLSFSSKSPAQESPAATRGFFRFPAIHGDTLVFTAEGDLWTAPFTGGVARRLTSHPGAETHAVISPDGKSVAFTAEYEGPAEVYVMPLAGGLPKRLTWHGESAKAAGWTPRGRVLYSTRAYSTLPNNQLVSVDPVTGDETLLPLAQADEGAMDDSGKRLFFTRLPFQGSSTKRYKGGTAQNLWLWAEGAEEAAPLTGDFPGTSKNPMWWRDRVYFISDRSGVLNLWSMNPDGSDLKQLTRHGDFDVKYASMHNGRIAYQHGADLRLFDVETGTDVLIPLTLSSDFDQTREQWVKKPLEYLTSARLSADGSRVALTARGEVFVAPAEPGGRLARIPRAPGVRYRNARFFPDGKSLLAQTDETGEIEFARLPANGVGAPELLTRDGTVFRHAPELSPDGRWIAWQDQDRRLWVRDLSTGQSRQVAASLESAFDDLTWSPDGRWLAFVETAANTYRQIRLFRPADGTLVTATSDRVNSFAPAWSADGKWLYFLSERALRSLTSGVWGARQPEPFFTEHTKIYALALRRGLRSPFEPPDELTPAAPEAKNEKKEGAKEKAGDTPVTEIELDGLEGRLHALPVPPGNYGGLVATAKHLFFTARDTGFDRGQRLMRLEITHREPKAKVFVEGVRSWELSQNGKKALIRKEDKFYVVPSDGEAPAKLEKPVPLDGWTFSYDPREEWRQIYREAWRMLRDYFYDPNMHGVDWPAVLKKYEPLVDRVTDRAELSEVLHEMGGELSALHTFVRFGDVREGPDNIEPASLGARLTKDPAAGGWRVERVFRADPDYPEKLSPLGRPGVDMNDGDLLLSINGFPALSAPHPAQLLRRQAGKPVLLEVKPGDNPEAAPRSVLVKPLSVENARELRYDDWEYSRRLETEKLGGGAIGYVHLRAMGGEDIATWARDFYPVFNRQGLVIDVRHNRGGNIDSWILEKLMRKAWFYWSRRTGNPYWNMQYAFRGHVVVLCNERTASDGEAFAEGFKRLGMGKVIGTRTWGGEIWLSARRWLIDNGMVSAAEAGVYGPEGEWLIEGHGVEPDIVVDNPPHAAFQGRDYQLEAAVKHLKELIEKDPRPVPPVPPKPDKSVH